jgi:hypothetical protein
MSGKEVTQFQVTNFSIMESTLTRLGHNFKKQNDSLIVERPYYNIVVEKNSVSCDTMNKTEVERIIYEYQKDFQIYECKIRGEQYNIVENEDEIIIVVD